MVDQASVRTGSEKIYDLAINYAGRVICYFSTGLGATGLCYFDEFHAPVEFLKSCGTVAAIGSITIIGFLLFNFYEKALGEPVLYKLQHIWHHHKDILDGLTGDNHTSTIDLLEHYQVEPILARSAYKLARRHLYKGDEHFSNQMSHVEVHTLYILFFLLLAHSLVVYVKYNSGVHAIWWLISSFTVLLYILYYDTELHSAEAEDIRLNKDSVIAFLRSKNKMRKVSLKLTYQSTQPITPDLR